MPTHVVTVRRTLYAYRDITVEAEDALAAATAAEAAAADPLIWEGVEPCGEEIEALPLDTSEDD